MNRLLKFLPIVAACALLTPAHAAILSLDLLGSAGVGLLPGNENATINGTPGSGGEIGAGITFNDATKVLTINVGWGLGNGFTNLTGNASDAHLHGPASASNPFGTNAGVVVGFSASTTPGVGFSSASFVFNNSASSGSISGTVTLDATREAELLANRLYINVHTSANPGGEIRGNIVPEPGVAGLVTLGVGALAMRRRR